MFTVRSLHVFLFVFSLLSASVNAIKIIANVDVGYGNAVFISSDSEDWGRWKKAYRLENIKKDTWEIEADLLPGSLFKLIKAPWKSGEVIQIDVGQSCGFETGSDHTISSGASITLKPNFENRIYSASCANVAEKPGNNINFYNINSLKCLDVQKNEASIANCTFKDGQLFEIEEIKNEIYNIKNQENYCLEVVNSSKEDGADIRLAPCTGGENQEIVFRNSPDDSMYRFIVFMHNNKCLDIFEKRRSSGTKIHQWSCGERSQEFFINRSTKKNTLPHVVWSYWDGGKADMPPFYQANVMHWESILNSGNDGKWKIIVLNNLPDDENYFGNFVNKESLPSPQFLQSKIGDADFEQKLKSAVIFSDFVRLEVLHEHGGVWIDPSIMLHEPLNNFETALQMADFTLAGYSSRHQATSEFRYADSLENFFLMALPKNQVIKAWKDNFRRYWDIKKPKMAIENHPMYDGSTGLKMDISRYGTGIKDYLNQHIALKYTLENNPSFLKQVFVIGGVNQDEKGPFTLLNLAGWKGEALLDMNPSQFDDLLRNMQDVVISKFPSVNSIQIRQKKNIQYFFDADNIFGLLNQSNMPAPVTKTVWGFWESGEENLPAFNKYAVNHWRKLLEPAGYEIRILNLKENDKNNAITVLGGKELLPKNWNALDDIVKPYKGPDGKEVKMVPSIVRSDLIRLAILEKFGGVWMDTSNALLRPLDAIVIDAFNATKKTVAAYVMDTYASADSPKVDGVPVDGMENWLIIAKPESPLIKAWRKAFVNYWETRKKGEWIQDHELYKNDHTFTFGGLGNAAANYLNQHVALKYVLHVNPAIYLHIYPIRDLHPWWLHSRADNDKKSLYEEVVAPNIKALAAEIKDDKVGLMKFAGGHLSEINNHFKTIEDYCTTPNLFTILYDHCP